MSRSSSVLKEPVLSVDEHKRVKKTIDSRNSEDSDQEDVFEDPEHNSIENYDFPASRARIPF